MRSFGKSVPPSGAWQRDGMLAFDSIQRLVQRLITLDKLRDESAGPAELATAFANVELAHGEAYETLGLWVKRHAPGRENAGKRDPTRGRFQCLSQSLQEGYQAAAFEYLLFLASTVYAGSARRDGLYERALETSAVRWYNAAMTISRSLIETGQPIGVQFIVLFTDTVYKPYKPERELFEVLSPWVERERLARL